MNKLNKILFRFMMCFGIFFLLNTSGCKVSYSFSGASIPPEAKTCSIGFFKNTASLVEPTLSQLFTDALRNKMANQTRLALVDRDGDLQFEGMITDYRPSQPSSIAGETAAMNRMTITVKVAFTNKIEPAQSFDKSFSRYVDYNSSLDLGSVQSSLMDETISLLIEDIFNQAVVNW